MNTAPGLSSCPRSGRKATFWPTANLCAGLIRKTRSRSPDVTGFSTKLISQPLRLGQVSSEGGGALAASRRRQDARCRAFQSALGRRCPAAKAAVVHHAVDVFGYARDQFLGRPSRSEPQIEPAKTPVVRRNGIGPISIASMQEGQVSAANSTVL